MSVRSLNWMKFGGLVALAFGLGLFFAGIVDAPTPSLASQSSAGGTFKTVAAPALQGVEALAQLSDGFATVVDAVKPSVVLITSERTVQSQRVPSGFDDFFRRFQQQPEQGYQEGRGSGFVVTNDGYILTNNHVVAQAERVTVRLPDRREFEAKVVGTDPSTDLAVLKIDADRLSPVALGNSNDARVGQWVLAIGNPLGEALTFTVTSGIVSAKGRGLAGLPGWTTTSIQDFIQTDAAINPGNSGGPLVNLHGEVIGINSAIASETGYNVGYGFAIPINLARRVMSQIIEHGEVHRAALMVNISEVTPVDAEYAGLKDIRGVLVTGIPDESSPARKAGIKEGDIILSIDGKPVDYVAELQQEIGFRNPGDVVKVDLVRKGGERKEVSVKLAALSTGTQVASADNNDNSGENTSGSELSRLGVTVQPLSQDDLAALKLTARDQGLAITNVRPGGPAWERLSARRGAPDIITAVEGKPVHSEADLRDALRHPGPGNIVSLDVVTPTQSGPLRRIVRVKLDD